jgi:hypothetical protein
MEPRIDLTMNRTGAKVGTRSPGPHGPVTTSRTSSSPSTQQSWSAFAWTPPREGWICL